MGNRESNPKAGDELLKNREEEQLPESSEEKSLIRDNPETEQRKSSENTGLKQFSLEKISGSVTQAAGAVREKLGIGPQKAMLVLEIVAAGILISGGADVVANKVLVPQIMGSLNNMLPANLQSLISAAQYGRIPELMGSFAVGMQKDGVSQKISFPGRIGSFMSSVHNILRIDELKQRLTQGGKNSGSANSAKAV